MAAAASMCRPREGTTHRPALRLSRILACAAVPVMLVVAGCSSASLDTKGSGSSASASAGKSEQAVEPPEFTELPEASGSIAKKSVKASAESSGKADDKS
uniref:DUF3558 domain-containing protein n=1 Tax=Streptomyces sp. NBC_01401 TaxID=2903854 RepID=A0AAU3GW12_9ACTN